MNNLIGIDPWSIFDGLFNPDSRALQTARARAAGRFPPANVYLDDSAILIDLELPGKTASDIELSLEPQAVVIADRPAKTEENPNPRPAWSRRVELPFRVESEKASAKFTDGVLRVSLPKAEGSGVRHIAIQG